MVGGENVESLNGIGQLILCEDRHKPSREASDDEKVHSTQSVSKVVFQKPTAPQIRQRILCCCKKQEVDGFVWELTFAQRL